MSGSQNAIANFVAIFSSREFDAATYDAGSIVSAPAKNARTALQIRRILPARGPLQGKSKESQNQAVALLRTAGFCVPVKNCSNVMPNQVCGGSLKPSVANCFIFKR